MPDTPDAPNRRAAGLALLGTVAALVTVGVALGSASCGRDDAPPAGEPEAAGAEPQYPEAALPRSLALPDSLLLRLPSGAEVWWTLARESPDSGGTTCVERGLEIRRDQTRVTVPLLYTADVPEVVDDTTIQVPLWTNCRPGRVYRVNIRTGQPTPAPLAGE